MPLRISLEIPDPERITDPDPERIPDALKGIGYYIGITTAPQGCGYHIAH